MFFRFAHAVPVVEVADAGPALLVVGGPCASVLLRRVVDGRGRRVATDIAGPEVPEGVFHVLGGELHDGRVDLRQSHDADGQARYRLLEGGLHADVRHLPLQSGIGRIHPVVRPVQAVHAGLACSGGIPVA